MMVSLEIAGAEKNKAQRTTLKNRRMWASGKYADPDFENLEMEFAFRICTRSALYTVCRLSSAALAAHPQAGNTQFLYTASPKSAKMNFQICVGREQEYQREVFVGSEKLSRAEASSGNSGKTW